jgi:hypothetical protein
MPSPIFLPAEEDTQVVINVKGKSPVTVDLFDLEDMFIAAQEKAKQQDTNWRDEFPAIYERKVKRPITSSQAVFLWEALKDRVEELKKSPLPESDDSSKQVSKSRPKRKRKSA